MHTINAQKLKELIKSKGGLLTVAHESLVSESTLKKMSANSYPSSPGRVVRHILASYFGVAEHVLFPRQRKQTSKAS